MMHSPGFLKLVNEAKSRVKEIDIAGYQKMRTDGEAHVLVDTREDTEWAAGAGPPDHRRPSPADGHRTAATTTETGDRLPGGSVTTASRRTEPRHEARRGASA